MLSSHGSSRVLKAMCPKALITRPPDSTATCGNGGIARIGEELGQIRRAGEPVGRHGIVVGPVIGMCPVVGPRRRRLLDHLAPKPGLGPRMDHPQGLGLGHCGADVHGDQNVGDVVGQVEVRGRALVHVDPRAVESGRVDDLPGMLRGVALRKLDVDQQLGLPGQLQGHFTLGIAENYADAPRKPELFHHGITRKGRCHRRPRGPACDRGDNGQQEKRISKRVSNGKSFSLLQSVKTKTCRIADPWSIVQRGSQIGSIT